MCVYFIGFYDLYISFYVKFHDPFYKNHLICNINLSICNILWENGL